MHGFLGHARAFSAALVLALLLSTTGCDTEATLGLDAAFFVGNWQMESVRDQNGDRDRTNEVREVVDDLRVTFRSDDTFRLLIDPREGTNQTIEGTYTVSPTGQLMLNTAGFSIPFDASTQGDNVVNLRASAAILQLVLTGAGVDISFAGTVVLALERGGPGA